MWWRNLLTFELNSQVVEVVKCNYYKSIGCGSNPLTKTMLLIKLDMGSSSPKHLGWKFKHVSNHHLFPLSMRFKWDMQAWMSYAFNCDSCPLLNVTCYQTSPASYLYAWIQHNHFLKKLSRRECISFQLCRATPKSLAAKAHRKLQSQ